jgi:hypothetical protein
LSALVACSLVVSVHAHEAGNRRMGKTPGFPAYPKISAPIANKMGSAPIQVHPDSIGNRVTPDHLNRVEFAHGRTENFMKNDVRVTEVVHVGRANYANVYRHEFEHHGPAIDLLLHRYQTVRFEHGPFLDIWHRHNFYGGFYYGFHPLIAIDTYFYNPLVFWFYSGTFNDYYYRNWYVAEYDSYPQLHKAFQYHGIYYPTENLRQLLFGVSGMTVQKQVQFREAINVFTKKMAQNMANILGQHIRLSSGDITVTHYEIVGYDEAIVLEGFVTHQGTGYDFKGFLDLRNPSGTTVVAPISMENQPGAELLKSVDDMNLKISALKGEAAPQTPAPETAPVENVPAAAEITAEPQTAN